MSYHTDTLMKQIWCNLVRDFRSLNGDPSFLLSQEKALQDGLSAFRKCEWPEVLQAPVQIHKQVYQMRNLFKRYIFDKDQYTHTELESKTWEKFQATQIRLGTFQESHTSLQHVVLQRARGVIRSILGKYDLEEHMSLCRFGKRASAGNPKHLSYLDAKVCPTMSGSAEHIRWFNENYLPTDEILSEMLGKDPGQVYNSLTITNVPKSYKALRTIMPHTTIGSFYSYGLGKMIENRLRNIGLDIKKLQSQHQELAKLSSKTRKNVTADLSSASDSFTAPLLNAVLPREWYNVLKYGRTAHITYDKKVFHMNSFMGMGIGFTFTLQTLVFYALLRALGSLTRIYGTYSVYGDDLIYPRKLHKYVAKVFPSLGFILNEDKTFVSSYFRESCGGDFYHGFDVRPYQPEGQSQALSKLPYLATLYKIYNGLQRRWGDSISRTLLFIKKEILRVDRTIYQVPPDYPDYSGIKVDAAMSTWYIPWASIACDDNIFGFAFSCLHIHPDRRVVRDVHAYYWDSMRQSSLSVELSDDQSHFFQTTFRSVRTPALRWDPQVQRSRRKGKVRKLIPTVASKNAVERFIRRKDSTSAWSLALP